MSARRTAGVPGRLAVAATAAVALALAVAGAAGADKPKSASPADTPRLPAVGTELVQLDVVVTGRDGRCVSGLDPAAFEVLEDGKRQAISHFAEESREGFRAAGEPTAAPAPAPGEPRPASAPAGSRGRRFVVAFDDLHTTAGNLAAAKKAMSRFVDEQISPDDWVALVSTSGNVGVYQDFTRDARALHRAIDRVTSRYVPVEPGGAPYLSEFQAELIDRNTDPEALRVAVEEILQTEDYLGEIGAREKAYAQARRMVFEIQARTGRALGAIEVVVRSLAPVPGRKIVVLVSDGFLVGADAAENRTFDVRRIIDAATRSGVVVYALDTRGLIADVPGGSASFTGPGVLTAPGARSNLQSRGNEAQKQSLNALAEDTGGFLVQNTNDLNAGLGKILRDNEVYYLLAYEPTNVARDGKFRKLRVRVAGRPDLEVRTRSGYFAPDDTKPVAEETPEARRERELGQALASLFPLEGVPTRMSADFIALPPAGPQAVVRARLDVSGVPFVPRSDRYEADVEIAVAVYDEAGQLVGNVSGERAQLSLTEDSYRRALAQGLTVQRTVPLAPGRYQVRLAAREATRSLLGSAHAWVEIPDVASRPLTLSSVFLLADSGEGTEGAGLDDAQVDRRFGRTQGLHYVVQVYEPPAGGADVVLQAQVWRGRKLVGVTPEHALAAGPEGRKWSERLSLASFEPGSFDLVVIATDRVSKHRAERRTSFRVE